MNDETIRSEVRALVASMSPRADVTVADPTAKLEDDLNYDSLTKIELAVALERMFQLTAVQEEDVMGIDTVADIEELVITVRGRSPA
jgi:acyl carrier protein